MKLMTGGFSIVLMLVAMLTTGIAQSAPKMANQSAADAIVGFWKDFDDDGHVTSILQVWRAADKYNIRIYKVVPQFSTEGKLLSDPKELGQPCSGDKKMPMLCLTIGRNLTYDKDSGIWRNGNVCDPRDGKSYNAKVWLEGKDKNQLKMRGYAGISLFGKTVTWQRTVKPLPALVASKQGQKTVFKRLKQSPWICNVATDKSW